MRAEAEDDFEATADRGAEGERAAAELGGSPDDVQAEAGGSGAALAAAYRHSGGHAGTGVGHREDGAAAIARSQSHGERGAVGSVGEDVADQRVDARLEIGATQRDGQRA